MYEERERTGAPLSAIDLARWQFEEDKSYIHAIEEGSAEWEDNARQARSRATLHEARVVSLEARGRQQDARIADLEYALTACRLDYAASDTETEGGTVNQAIIAVIDKVLVPREPL